jgi:ferric-dicitrate binding protein FerR (iron transport regulator)
MQDFDFIVLLNKRFSGEINATESAALDAWISQSAANAELATQYQRIWDNSPETQQQFSLDLEQEFQQLQARIKNTEKLPTPVIPIGRWMVRAAAAVAFVLASVWGYQQIVPEVPATVVEVATDATKRQITLSDGTTVWLRQNAKLEFPKTFGKKQRLVKLTGEAYFEVAHQDGRPFRVELPESGLVEVLGTRFNVRTGAQTSVLVREGRVRFAPIGKGKDVLLTAGDKAVFHAQNAEIRLSKVATFNELAWQTGGLEFVRTPLKTVIADLEAHYAVKIELRNQALQQCYHTAPLTNQSIDQVLQSLALTYHFKLTNPAPGHFILSKGNCR